ncbi:MAG: L,D-transpeptidase [Flavobacteriales bacterium]|nr:L,D-transpeptidase [Flavobacteriales bacterium]MBL6873085.1 L,D-transpeptidase [Flavobacteriales bacterium]
MLFVSISKQKLFYIKNNSIISEYPISSAKKGVGNQKNSDKTPLGLHSIKEKHGAETPINGRMIGRIFYGQIATIDNDTTTSKTDDITSRIMWLSGEEFGINKGKNIDSYQRYIYIHGTSEEGKIGTPASHGCIRMRNKDIIELFSVVKLNTKVLILE